MKKMKFDLKSLRSFGNKSAIGFMILGILFAILKKGFFVYFLVASGIFAILTLIAPKSLKYIYIIITKITEPLSWVMTRVIFFIFFFIIVTPISFLIKLLGKDLLHAKIDKNSSTYWKKKEAKNYDKAHFERQF